MAQKELTTTQLIEKIVRAKVMLEGMRREHNDSCSVVCDPESFAPCNCGASTQNAKVQAALRELGLD